MNQVQRNYVEAKKTYEEAGSTAWAMVDLMLEEKGIDYDDMEQTEAIIKIEESCYEKLNVTGKKREFMKMFSDLKEWGVGVIKKQDVPNEEKEAAIDLLEKEILPQAAHRKIEELLLNLDGAA